MGSRMKSILVFTIVLIIALFIFIILKLISKIRIITKEADMWHRLAVTDDLTGIYNRNAYNSYINKIKDIKNKQKWVILFDVDDFKMINDIKGHLAGDSVLKNVAKILAEVFSDRQYAVFRIGGDEFSVLADGVSERRVIERLLALNKALEEYGDIRLSKGYSIIKDSREEAFKYADEMLYADKRSKKLQSSLQDI